MYITCNFHIHLSCIYNFLFVLIFLFVSVNTVKDQLTSAVIYNNTKDIRLEIMIDSTSIYVENGFSNRKDYLTHLAAEHGEKVFMLADMLGPSEDFDGLVTMLEDCEEGF